MKNSTKLQILLATLPMILIGVASFILSVKTAMAIYEEKFIAVKEYSALIIERLDRIESKLDRHIESTDN